MKLNLGCGAKPKEGWINIDLYPQVDGVVRGNIEKLDYPDESVEEICSDMSLEHISYCKTEDVLKEWFRVLRGGGTIWVRTINLDEICKDWLGKSADYTRNLRGMFGSQIDEGQYHKTGFDFLCLKTLFNKAGFSGITEECPDHPHHLIVTARKHGGDKNITNNPE